MASDGHARAPRRPKLGAAKPGVKQGLARHFEGWQPGLVAVLIAVLGSILVVPLEAPPRDVPLPIVNPRALAAAFAHDRALSDKIGPELEHDRDEPRGQGGLYDLRALGSAVRAYGIADASGEAEKLLRARDQLLAAVTKARALGDDKLVALRAYELEAFLEEVRRWERTGEDSEELRALGGGFVALVMRSGWVRPGRHVALSEPLRAVFFKRRWSEITGLKDGVFDLSLDEKRSFYAFLLSYPARTPGDANDLASCRRLDQFRLRKVEELGKQDPAYPRSFARGVLLSRLGQYHAAIEAFNEHMAHASDGPYAMRARNYLAAVRARVAGD